MCVDLRVLERVRVNYRFIFLCWTLCSIAAFSDPLTRPLAVFGYGGLNAVAYAPDGQKIAIAHSAFVSILDANTGELLTQLIGHTEAIQSVCFSPDSAFVLTGSHDDTARLWDTATGAEVRAFVARDAIADAVFSPEGRRIAVCKYYEPVALLNALSMRQVGVIASLQARAVRFTPDGNHLLARLSNSPCAELWDISTVTRVGSFGPHGASGKVTDAAMSPDGARVLTSATDGPARLWDVDSQSELRQLTISGRGIRSVAFSPDGHFAACGTYGGYGIPGDVVLWNLESGEYESLGLSSPRVTDVTFSSDGVKILAGGSSDASWYNGPSIGLGGSWKVWDLALQTVSLEALYHTDHVSSLIYTEDGEGILSGSYDRTALLWQIESRHVDTAFVGHSDGISAVAFSSSGLTVATASFDKTARLWRRDTGEEIRRFEGHERGLTSVAISPDGTILLTGSSDSTGRLWRLADGEFLHTLPGHEYVGIDSVAYSNDGNYVAIGSFRGIKVWDAHDYTPVGDWQSASETLTWLAPTAFPGALLSVYADCNDDCYDYEGEYDIGDTEGGYYYEGEDSHVESETGFEPDVHNLGMNRGQFKPKCEPYCSGKAYIRGYTSEGTPMLIVESSSDGFQFIAENPKRNFLLAILGIPDYPVCGAGVVVPKWSKVSYDTPVLAYDVTTGAFSPDGSKLATGHVNGGILLWSVPRVTADFTASATSGVGPFKVQFQNTTQLSPPTIWKSTWYFGDGTSSTLRNPNHSYAPVEEETVYSVTLVAEASSGESDARVYTNLITLNPGVAPCWSGVHAADSDANFQIDLPELLRIVQFYNMGAFRCALAGESSEDGFVAGVGEEHHCCPHDSDYQSAAPDWHINLSELLRVVQFWNSGGYYACVASDTEDGFCPGMQW